MQSEKIQDSKVIGYQNDLNLVDQSSLDSYSRDSDSRFQDEKSVQLKNVRKKTNDVSYQQSFVKRQNTQTEVSQQQSTVSQSQKVQLNISNQYQAEQINSFKFSQNLQQKPNQNLQNSILNQMPPSSDSSIFAQISNFNQSSNSFSVMNSGSSNETENVHLNNKSNQNQKSSQQVSIIQKLNGISLIQNQNNESSVSIVNNGLIIEQESSSQHQIEKLNRLGEMLNIERKEESYCQQINKNNVQNVAQFFSLTQTQINHSKYQDQQGQNLKHINCQLIHQQMLELQLEQINQIRQKVLFYSRQNKQRKQKNFHQSAVSMIIESSKIAQNITKNSQIVTDTVQAQNLVSFFNKKISSVQLKFRASQHNFKISKFFDICGQLTDLLLICKTQKEKIIGAYSPPFHKCVDDCQWVEDSTGQSFMYSLTNNHKFFLRNKRYATYRYRTMNNLCFGNGELEICDQSNEREDCCTLLNYFYYNPNYTPHQLSWQSFNGNPRTSFKTLQWEIWQVKFQK